MNYYIMIHLLFMCLCYINCICSNLNILKLMYWYIEIVESSLNPNIFYYITKSKTNIYYSNNYSNNFNATVKVIWNNIFDWVWKLNIIYT